MTNPIICGLCGTGLTGLSRVMHNAAFAECSVRGVYSNFETDDTPYVLDAMRKLELKGYSLTIPHKEAAMELVDEVESRARVIGAINTVINKQGRLSGYNTDCDGIEGALAEVGVELLGKEVLLLGAGGVARAALYVFARLGVKRVRIYNRNIGRAEELAADFSVRWTEAEDKLVMALECFSELPGQLETYSLVFNATPIGSKLAPDTEDNKIVDPQKLSSDCAVFETVLAETALVSGAASTGLKLIRGYQMLLLQACRQFELFADVDSAPKDVMKEALCAELGENKDLR